MEDTRVFGPVPSRRLGKSVGINNIPPKICTYSCVYCQLGKSLTMMADRQAFYDPDTLVAETQGKLEKAAKNNEPIDYLTIVSDGEPTLDAGLGPLIQGLAPLGIKTAVITNSTLLHRPDVRQDLCRADWVSVKVDTMDESIWRKIDRPHKAIKFDALIKGVQSFAEEYTGKLVTETMLVQRLNDDKETLGATARFIGSLNGSLAYLSIPTRPPALSWVTPPTEEKINQAFYLFQDNGLDTEYLVGYEGNQFAYTGDIETDILSITAVHPMRRDAVDAYLKKAKGKFSAIEKLVDEKKLIVSEYQNQQFYLRTLAQAKEN